MTTDVFTSMAAMGSRAVHASNDMIASSMGSRKLRADTLGPATMTGTNGAAFSKAITGARAGSTLSATSSPAGFTASGTNLVASSPGANTYTVTVVETNAALANSPNSSTITVTIS